MAYTLSKADVLAVAPELAELDDVRWGVAMGTAQAMVSNSEAWGDDTKAKIAAVWLAAHLGKLAMVSARAKPGVLAPGPVTEMHVGPIGKTFASLGDFVSEKSALSASLTLTQYGLTFLSLRRQFSFGRFTTT